MHTHLKIFFSPPAFCHFTSHMYFLFIACCLLPVASFSQSITFEKYYDTINCYNGQCVQQTFDKGYIITGTHSVYAGNNNLVILKTDSFGNPQWLKSYGGTNNDGGEFVQQTLDSGYIVVGERDAISSTDSKIWLLKTDKNGDTIWTKAITAGIGANLSTCIQLTTDGGYIISGYTSAKGAGSYDVFLVKTNSTGDTLWTKIFGGPDADVSNFVGQTNDGGYIVVGSYMYSNFSKDVYLIKTNSNGDSLWTKKFGGSRTDVGQSVKQTSDGGYIIAGETTSFKDTIGWDIYLIKTDVNGDTLWTKDLFDTASSNAYSIEIKSDGGYIIIGDNSGNPNGAVYIVRTNSAGDTLWTKSYGQGHAMAWSGTTTSDGGCIVTGQFDKYSPYSIYLLKTDSLGFAVTGINEAFSIKNNISIYPNPFSLSATVIVPEEFRKKNTRYEIIDLLGNSVYNNEMRIGNESFIIEKGNIVRGIYFLKIFSNSHIAIVKMVVQ